jgi:hypothetical protein
METPLTILYTHRLRGDLTLLPRIYTFMRRLRAEHAADGMTLRLDLGDSCAPEVFPCALTGGRSTLIALDAMGYDAANVEGWLSSEDRIRLETSHLSMGLVDASHPMHMSGLRISVSPVNRPSNQTRKQGLEISLRAGETTSLDIENLHLAAIHSREVGMARIEPATSRPRLAAHQTFVLPDQTLPDPTIAATIEFILNEARYVQRKRAANE